MSLSEIQAAIPHRDPFLLIDEVVAQDEKHIHSSAPRAIRALSSLIENPKAKDHARRIATALDRVHPVETIQKVAGEHHSFILD